MFAHKVHKLAVVLGLHSELCPTDISLSRENDKGHLISLAVVQPSQTNRRQPAQ